MKLLFMSGRNTSPLRAEVFTMVEVFGSILMRSFLVFVLFTSTQFPECEPFFGLSKRVQSSDFPL